VIFDYFGDLIYIFNHFFSIFNIFTKIYNFKISISYQTNGKLNPILSSKSIFEILQWSSSNTWVIFILFSDVHRNQSLLAKNLALKEFIVGGHNRAEVILYIKNRSQSRTVD
jgi:hypothetical protein